MNRKHSKKKSILKKHSGVKEIKSKDKRKVKRKWWKRILSFLIFCGAVFVFGVFSFFVYIVASCQEFNPNALANQDQTIIYDSKDNIIAKLGMEKRESVNYDKLPQVLIDAIIATEDSRYFEHNGVDGARFLKASFGQVLGHRDAGGASTLTMQVVKNNLTSREQSIIRKFKDVYLAVFFMEKKYTKEEILEFYVNDSLLGGNVYGVEEACKYYFGKSVSEISLPEAAIIAGLFQSPNGYNPYNYPDKAKARRSTVLKLMVRHGYITQEEADIANDIDVKSLLVGTGSSDNQYQGFIDTVVEEVKKKTKSDPALASMEIHTTMDPTIQNGINKVMAGDGYNWINDVVQAGVTVLDVKTGAITAIGTGRNRVGERQWNYATQSYRQPGSTAKPIFAYGPGFEFDNFSTYQLFNDEPWSYTGGGTPGNWDGGYQGLMTLRSAIGVSRNIPAIKAFQQVNKDAGNKKIVQFVEGLGIELKDHVAYESYAIGGLETGVNTVQMAGAYAAFANGGYYTEPYTVKSITYRDTGETTEFEHKKTQAMKSSTAYLTTDVLRTATFRGGTGGYGGTVAVKTGTSNYDEATMRKHGLPGDAVNDLWSVAYTPQYAISLWYGYDKIDVKYYNGGASGTYKDNLMAAVMRHIPVTHEEFKKPDSVVSSQVEFGTWPAQLPSEYTPQDLIRTEYFTAGTEPTEASSRFAKLNDVTNLKANETSDGIKLTWDHKKPEVIEESYLKKYFSQDAFGNGTDSMVKERMNYNNNILGGLGYGIYLNGKLVAFTTDKKYTYKPAASGNISLVVKAEYKNFKNNASSGVSVKVNAKVADVPVINNSGLDINIIDGKNVEIEIGSYNETGVEVTFDNVNVTSDCEISYTIDGKKYSSPTEVEAYVNSITEAKKIVLRYSVSYEVDGENVTKTANKNITLK